MGREIKFKAKSSINGEWIFGNIMKGNKTFISIDLDNVYHCFDVDGNTVCQFAWHDAKHNQDVYEYDYDESGYCIIYCPICRGWAVAKLDDEHLAKGMKHLIELDNGRNENCFTCSGETYLYEIVDDFKVVGNLMD